LKPNRLLAGLCIVVSLAGCAPQRRGAIEPSSSGTRVGVYKVRSQPRDEKSRRFKLMLYAASPDRLHGEVLSPLGSPVMSFDGGDGQLAVTLVRDRLTFVGDATPGALAPLFGVAISLSDLVAALLEGVTPDAAGWTLERPDGSGLPESLTITSESGTMSLQLKRWHVLKSEGSLGTGEPPRGMELRPLEELRLHEVPLPDEEVPE